jgi:hypothetical protein
MSFVMICLIVVIVANTGSIILGILNYRNYR